jgi:hypothetical protein
MFKQPMAISFLVPSRSPYLISLHVKQSLHPIQHYQVTHRAQINTRKIQNMNSHVQHNVHHDCTQVPN